MTNNYSSHERFGDQERSAEMPQPDSATLARLSELSMQLLTRPEEGKFLSFPFNLIRMVLSQGSSAEYREVLRHNKPTRFNLALISFPLPEFLCFSGENTEWYQLKVPGQEFNYQTICRLDSDFWEAVYYKEEIDSNQYTQVFGIPELIRNFKDSLPGAKDYLSYPVKTFFTLALTAPVVEDTVLNTGLRRSLLRFAVAGLNRFADVHRKYVGIAWSTVPHYSFYSFPYGYIREFDLGGALISSDKYMMNPASGFIEGLPRTVDSTGNAGNARAEFERSLLADEKEDEFLGFCKGEAYVGHGHDEAAIRFCVSALDALLRRWVKESKVVLRDTTPEKARLKTLLGKFEEHMKLKKLVPNADELMSQVKDAINLRHAVEHEGFHGVDSTIVFPVVEVLKKFFGVIRSELRALHVQEAEVMRIETIRPANGDLPETQ